MLTTFITCKVPTIFPHPWPQKQPPMYHSPSPDPPPPLTKFHTHCIFRTNTLNVLAVISQYTVDLFFGVYRFIRLIGLLYRVDWFCLIRRTQGISQLTPFKHHNGVSMVSAAMVDFYEDRPFELWKKNLIDSFPVPMSWRVSKCWMCAVEGFCYSIEKRLFKMSNMVV